MQLKCNNEHKQNKKRRFMKPESKTELLLEKKKTTTIPQTQEDPKQWEGFRKSYIFTSLRQLPL